MVVRADPRAEGVGDAPFFKFGNWFAMENVGYISGGSESGLAAGARVTWAAAAATRTITGTHAVLQLDSDVGAGNTLGGTHSFIRVVDNGSVKIPYFLSFGQAAASGSAVQAVTAGAHGAMSIPILVNGAVWYIGLSSSAS
jgi:hypothetical protein